MSRSGLLLILFCLSGDVLAHYHRHVPSRLKEIRDLEESMIEADDDPSALSSSFPTQLIDHPLSSSLHPMDSNSLDLNGNRYGSRMALSGSSSGQSSLSSGVANSVPITNLESGLGATFASVLGSGAIASAIAYRNWQTFKRVQDQEKQYTMTVRLDSLRASDGTDVHPAITLTQRFSKADDLTALIQTLCREATRRVQSFPQLAGLSISKAELYRVLPGSDPESQNQVVKVLDVADILPNSEYVLIPSGTQSPHRQVCVPLMNPCPKKKVKQSCAYPGKMMNYPVGASPESSISVEVPEFASWLKHKRFEIKKLGGQEQTIKIHDEETGTFCDLTITIPDRVHSVNHRNPEEMSVLFFQKNLTEEEFSRLFGAAEEDEGKLEPYYTMKAREGLPVNY